MPTRPDQQELVERTEIDRQEAGLPADPGGAPVRIDPEAPSDDE